MFRFNFNNEIAIILCSLALLFTKDFLINNDILIFALSVALFMVVILKFTVHLVLNKKENYSFKLGFLKFNLNNVSGVEYKEKVIDNFIHNLYQLPLAFFLFDNLGLMVIPVMMALGSLFCLFKNMKSLKTMKHVTA